MSTITHNKHPGKHQALKNRDGVQMQLLDRDPLLMVRRMPHERGHDSFGRIMYPTIFAMSTSAMPMGFEIDCPIVTN